MGGHTKALWLPVSITVYSCDFNPISISPHLGFVSFHFFPLWLCILGPIRETQSTSDCQTHQPLFPKYHLQGVAWRSTGWHSTLSLPWAWFWSLVRELRSRQLSGRPTKEQKTKQTQNTTSRNTNIPTHTQTGFRLVPASVPCKKSIVSECSSSCPPTTELSDSCGWRRGQLPWISSLGSFSGLKFLTPLSAPTQSPQSRLHLGRGIKATPHIGEVGAAHPRSAAQPPQRSPRAQREEHSGSRPCHHTTPKTRLPRTRTTCSAWPVPTALVTVQMKVVLNSRSTEWTISLGPWATAEAGKTPEVLEGVGVT